MRDCKHLLEGPVEHYVQALLTHEERMFDVETFALVGVAQRVGGEGDEPGCGHFCVYVQLGQENDPRKRRVMKPCFFTEEAAQAWSDDVRVELVEQLKRAGKNPQRFNLN